MTELENLLERYPSLEHCGRALKDTVEIMCASFRSGGKLVLAGNGGSASDCEHIVGELEKEFKIRHKRDEIFDRNFLKYYPQDGELLSKLTPSVSAVSLVSGVAINTAMINDIGAEVIFAQRAYAMCRSGDVFMGISTSGNSRAVIAAMKVAKVLGCKIIALTGKTGGLMKEYADVLINVPEEQTYRVQELHLPVYHYLCAQTERELFWEKNV